MMCNSRPIDPSRPPFVRVGATRAMLVTLGVLSLTSCAVGPRFEAPDAQAPDSWHTGHAASTSTSVASTPVSEPASAQWWTLFDDPQLNALEKRLSQSNLDLQIAMTRLMQ